MGEEEGLRAGTLPGTASCVSLTWHRREARSPLWKGRCVQPVKWPSNSPLEFRVHIQGKNIVTNICNSLKSLPRNSTSVWFFSIWLVFWYHLSSFGWASSWKLCFLSAAPLPWRIARIQSLLITEIPLTFLLLISLKSLSTSVFRFPQSDIDIYICLSDKSCSEIFCFLVMQEPILSSASPEHPDRRSLTLTLHWYFLPHLHPFADLINC